MTSQVTITNDLKEKIKNFLEENKPSELVNTYLFFIQNKYRLHPVLNPKKKVIYKDLESAVADAQKDEALWREAEIKVTFAKESVNEETEKIYICPFSGKVFGDNTHPNPQDAIYEWVSKCPENTERVGGLKVKRFFVSEDPEVIRNYLKKELEAAKKPLTKKVYSSVLSGKIFNSKEAVVEDFKKNYLKPLSLIEVQSQNRYDIEVSFLEFVQEQLEEDKVAAFIEALAEHEEFIPYVEEWLD